MLRRVPVIASRHQADGREGSFRGECLSPEFVRPAPKIQRREGDQENIAALVMEQGVYFGCFRDALRRERFLSGYRE
ncbi:hypothetical protein GN316_18110 [Xylophilus sp. Kf1]|nr:hypothetical protein [Xylophilus sp. Kf1]